MARKMVDVSGIQVANDNPFVLFGGMNVLESRELAFEVAEAYVEACSKLGIPYVFKASFDKANRSSVNSFRGPGLEKGLQILADCHYHCVFAAYAESAHQHSTCPTQCV